MLIDWFTVGAQVLNFLLLIWLMKRYLYEPILHAIAARESKIAAELAEADARKAEAQKERAEFQHKNEEFDEQRAVLWTKATDDAGKEGRRLLEEARQTADAVSAKRQDALREDVRNLSQSIIGRTQQEVFAIARKTLADLATASLEERVGAVFMRRLHDLNDSAKAGLTKALNAASEPAVVRSAFDLPAEQRAAIQNALNETFSLDLHLRFETAPDLIAGIEFITDGQKVAWSISDYLEAMEKGVAEVLGQSSEPVTAS